ncbi:MAG: VPLPA-CTERM sorting domain-containing protein [Pseudomonadota bacterium]
MPPGATSSSFFYDSAQITPGDVNFTAQGAVVSGSVSATRTRDGFADGTVVPDLFSATGTVDYTAAQTANGRALFGYDLSSSDSSLAGGGGLATTFSFTGFMGFDVEFGFSPGSGSTPFLAPQISRSSDGDTIEVDIGFLGTGFSTLTLPETLFFSVADAGFMVNNTTSSVGIFLPTFGVGDEPFNGPLPQAVPISAVPLPAGLWSLGLAVLCALGLARRRRAV